MSVFLLKLFYKIKKFFIDISLLNNYFYYSIFLPQFLTGLGDFFIEKHLSTFFFNMSRS